MGMTWSGRRLLKVLGGASLAAFVTGAIVWPLAQGYPTLMHLIGDRFIPDYLPRYDRAPLVADLEASGFALGTPAHVRIFKRERRLEVWMARNDGRYARFRSYDICNHSGTLGPKLAEGDLQAPEGFYRVAQRQLNPQSRHYLAFNLGFPNAYDRSLGRTGSALMVHGGCSSVGCFAITDAAMDEVYAIVEAALDRGQDAVDVHVFPFALTDDALATEVHDPWATFWQNLKHGYNLFEASGVPPKVAACLGKYAFGKDAEGPDCDPIAAWS